MKVKNYGNYFIPEIDKVGGDVLIEFMYGGLSVSYEYSLN